MVDIETLDNVETSVILSIGAVRFDEDKIEDKFYVVLSPEEQIREYNRTVNGETIRWWMQQSKEARDAAFLASDRQSLQTALSWLAQWYGNDDRRPIWAKPATFDISILNHAYRQLGETRPPWHYRSTRCMSTLMRLLPQVKPDAVATVEHNALDDALEQALHVQLLLAKLGELK